MRQFPVVRGALGAIAALFALSVAQDASAIKFTKISKTAFTAEIPAGWKMVQRRKHSGTDLTLGRYVWRSGNGNNALRVNFQKDPGGDFAKVAEADFKHFSRKIEDPEIVEKKLDKEDGRDVAFRVFKGIMIRKDFMRPYLFARILVRRPNAKKLVAFTLAMSNEKLDAKIFNEILGKFVDTLTFKDPKPAAPAKAAAVKK